MPPKRNSTPIKPSEGSTLTHEEEEAQHDISKLQEQLHQISLSQRETKNGMEDLKKGVEAKMDGLKTGLEVKMYVMEANMDGVEAKIDEKVKDNMENIKNDLKEDMECLKKLIQEMFPNRKNIVEETHDENKINVNSDFINSNVGWKNHHIPNIDMRKFYGKDPITWILHMEKYFDLNNVKKT